MTTQSPAIQPEAIEKIAFVNFGGIGDEILFAPVIEEVKKYLPRTHTTLFLEDRSLAVKDLLPGVDAFIPMSIQGQSRIKTFFKLWGLLRSKYFDVVISSGSSPFIPVLLFLSGIPIRIGFQTGKTSQKFLTAEAPLAKKGDPEGLRRRYAGRMYFALARTFLTWLLGDKYHAPEEILPHLKHPSEEDRQWARELLNPAVSEQSSDPTQSIPHSSRKKILIHPGVSLISIQKNIFKSWPAASWASLIRDLTQNHDVFLVGGPDDKESVEQIRQQLPTDTEHFTDLYGKTKNLKQLAALIEEADVLVCVDSSPMHLAVGYEKPVVVMYGPTDEKKLLPQEPRFKAVTLPDLACRPCLWDVRNINCDNPVCLDVPVQAMRNAVEEVILVKSI